MSQKLLEVKKNFARFSEWEDKYAYLIELGEELRPFFEVDKNENNIIEGCSSEAWLKIEVRNGVIDMSADSGSQIVKGLLAVVCAIYQGENVAAAKSIDMSDVFSELGLSSHLSLARQNGLAGIENKIRKTLESF